MLSALLFMGHSQLQTASSGLAMVKPSLPLEDNVRVTMAFLSLECFYINIDKWRTYTQEVRGGLVTLVQGGFLLYRDDQELGFEY